MPSLKSELFLVKRSKYFMKLCKPIYFTGNFISLSCHGWIAKKALFASLLYYCLEELLFSANVSFVRIDSADPLLPGDNQVVSLCLSGFMYCTVI